MKLTTRINALPRNTLIKIIDLVSWPLWILNTIRRNKLLRTATLGLISVTILIYAVAGWAGVVTAYGLGIRLGFMMLFMIVQFVAMFWFISRTRDTTLIPGDKGALNFEEDYFGNFNEVKLVREWVKLLTVERWKLDEIGAKTISGILLTGPPGVGKTRMMQCLADDAQALFASMSATSLQAMFVGIGPLKVKNFGRKLRNGAKQFGAAIGFLDEIDAVGGNRGGVVEQMNMDIQRLTDMGVNPAVIESLAYTEAWPNPQARSAVEWYRSLDWFSRRMVDFNMRPLPDFIVMGGGTMGGGSLGVLSALLVEMDGVQDVGMRDEIQNSIRGWFGIDPIDPGVVLWTAATNRPGVLDPAMTRPGRFDRKIAIGLPDAGTRRALFEGYLKKVNHDDTIDIDVLTDITAGVSHAFIASSVEKDSARLALFEGRTTISQKDIEQAIEENVVGLPNPIADLEPRQKEQISYHEAGHAVIAYAVREDKRIANVSTIRRGSGILGYVRDVFTKEVFARPLSEISADAMVSLAGHEAVRKWSGEHWTGGATDFQHVDMYMEFLKQHGKFGGIPITGNAVMEKRIADRQDKYQKELIIGTRDLINKHWEAIENTAQALIEQDELSSTEFYEIMEETNG